MLLKRRKIHAKWVILPAIRVQNGFVAKKRKAGRSYNAENS